MVDFLEFFWYDFGTRASILMVFVSLTTVPFCIIKKKWPDLGSTIGMLLGVAGTFAGAKIVVLTIYLPFVQLGALADDKAALVLGGIAAVIVSFRMSIENWRKVTGF